MERIFKIKTKTDRDPRSQYPSERRYSASIVIGLGVVCFQLFMYSILMGTLIVHKMTLKNETIQEIQENITTDDDGTIETKTYYYYVDVPLLVCASCYVMATGYLFSFITSVLAWKQWYVDHNITFFFISSSFSTITSAVSLVVSLITLANTNFNYNDYRYEIIPEFGPLTFSLILNIIILSGVGLLWSILATKISYQGMKTSYPDDEEYTKGGRKVEVSTVTKGDKNQQIYPPDIISHFPAKDKLAKYLPKKQNKNLPKDESNDEYRQRVEKFLDGEPENIEKA